MSRIETCKTSTLQKLAVGATLFMMVFALFLPTAYAEENDPWTNIPESEVIDWGEMWGTTIQFQYTYDSEIGNQAQTIEWDFGDGSPRSTEWNPEHTYTEHGTYNVVQHVTNSYEGFAEDWGYYRLTIMGKPYVEIVMPEGAEPVDKIYATKGTAPIMPETDPVQEGYDFEGYFMDEEFTVPFDWTVPIDTPVIVYAAFSDDGMLPTDPTEPTDPTTPENEGYMLNGSILILAGIGIFFGIFALICRNPFIVALALISIIISILGIVNIIEIPEILTNFESIDISNIFGDLIK